MAETRLSWLGQPDNFQPSSQKQGNLSRNILKILASSKSLRLRSALDEPSAIPALKILATLEFVLLCALSQKPVFLLICVALSLARLCLLKGEAIKSGLMQTLLIVAMSFLLYLPAAFLTHSQHIGLFCLRLFASTNFLLAQIHSFGFGQISYGLQQLGLSNYLIASIKLSLKSLFMLSRRAQEELIALKVRSFGPKATSTHKFSELVASLVISSLEMSKSVSEALIVRAFSCKPSFSLYQKSSLKTAIYLIFSLLILVLYLFVELV